MILKILANQEKGEARLQTQEASIRNLEIQMGQLANAISGRNKGTLPINSETNPKEQIKVITLRSGKVLEEQRQPQVEENKANQQQDKEGKKQKEEREVSRQQRGKSCLSNAEINVDTLPYPARAKKDKLEEKFSKFIDIFKKLEINILFVEALMQMPQYAKFLKEVLSGKRKIEEQGIVMLTESCSAILKNQLPTKLKDPGNFTIPCEFRNFKFNKVLCDLGARINLMSLSICRKLNLGELKETNIILQFADRSTKRPNGLIEDVLVRIGKFIYPCDFVVLDMEVDWELPLILGRPFLATTTALIDVKQGKLTLRLNDEEIVFDIKQAIKGPSNSCDDTCYFIDVIDECADHVQQEIMMKDSLEREEKLLIEVLSKHKKTIGWTISDVKGIIPTTCMHKILMEDTFKPKIQPQRRLNPTLQEVVKKEVVKLLDADLVLARCEESKLVLNWEKCHFMENEGIVLGHKILEKAPIVVAPDWTIPFELMCDASDYAVGVVLGQRKEKIFHTIYYASHTLTEPQLNYTTTEKELLVVVYAFEKFRSYLIGSKVVVYTDYAALRHLFAKKDSKPRLIRWILLLQEFDIKIRDKKGGENVVADHQSSLETEEVEKRGISELFSDEVICQINKLSFQAPWFADFVNFLAGGWIPKELSWQQRKKLIADVGYYFWEDPYLYKICPNQVVRRCVPETEFESILKHCHDGEAGGHFSSNRTASISRILIL
ncbi:hypothetical protein H6P81_006441 [Aristolochia fimbriata]|uniref:RNA-directed DNA polymerase n=1 Tax=Aristolochia fimbriata TaxID=158543 RepID=A0AAV7F0S9_ARIFI|nr:hypothetical protein H6P81_006441 [Aristolochia fimbriata]